MRDYHTNKKTIALLIISIMLTAAICAAEQNRGSAEITIDSGRTGNVSFPHHTHQDTIGDCNTCHRLFPQIPHAIGDSKAAGKLNKKQVMKMCRKCHRTMAKEGKKTGPTKCSGCHIKQGDISS